MKTEYRYFYYEQVDNGITGVFRFEKNEPKYNPTMFKYITGKDHSSQFLRDDVVNNDWILSWNIDALLRKEYELKKNKSYTIKEISEKEAFLLLI